MSQHLPTLDGAKKQARALRQSLSEQGQTLSHAQALEHVARQWGHRDWNTLHAAIGNRRPTPLAIGQQVTGRYLGQAISGRVLGLRAVAGGAAFNVTLQFDTPVDVIRFEGMSNLRSRVTQTVNTRGVTREKTSDGQPVLALDLV